MEQKIEVQKAPPKSVKIQQPNPKKKADNTSRNKIYVREVKGKVENVRRVVGFALMVMFVIIPWITWNGEQAVLLDIMNQRFRIFSLTLWPQDLTILAWVFMISAFALFLVTTLYGRVWCGFTCPQTSWTFMFMWFERKIEGTRNKRIQLDKRPMDADKLLRKIAKHTAWLIVALITSLTFVGYFTDIRTLFAEFFILEASAWATGCVLFFTFATYGNAGWMREIMCTHICPYARFQSAMFDKDTFIVAYDAKRGDPRGPRKRNADIDPNELGHCIDCKLCVQVCPTGIDIRDGLQYECINCGACVDACNDVMDKMNYARELISFTTEHQLEGQRTKLFRFKSIGYGIALVALTGMLVLNIAYRIPLEFDVIRDRNSLYRENQEGFIENVYTLRVINKSQQPQSYTLSVVAPGIDEVKWIGNKEVTLNGGQSEIIPVSLAIDPYYLKSPLAEVTFRIEAVDEKRIARDVNSNFIYQ